MDRAAHAARLADIRPSASGSASGSARAAASGRRSRGRRAIPSSIAPSIFTMRWCSASAPAPAHLPTTEMSEPNHFVVIFASVPSLRHRLERALHRVAEREVVLAEADAEHLGGERLLQDRVAACPSA